jgi:hypothetical protein
MTEFEEKWQRIKEKDKKLRETGDTLDPLVAKKKHEKMNLIFKKNIAKKIFDYENRRELINDFKTLTLREKRGFLLKEFGVDPDDEPDPKPSELREDLMIHDEAKRDLKVPVCRKCGKPHNPFDPCFGV